MLWAMAIGFFEVFGKGCSLQLLMMTSLIFNLLHHGVVLTSRPCVVSEIPSEPPDPHVRIRKSKAWIKMLRRRITPPRKCRSYYRAVLPSFPLRLRKVRFFPDNVPKLSEEALAQRELANKGLPSVDPIDQGTESYNGVELSRAYSMSDTQGATRSNTMGFTFSFGLPGTQGYDRKLLQTVSVLQTQVEQTPSVETQNFEFPTAQRFFLASMFVLIPAPRIMC